MMIKRAVINMSLSKGLIAFLLLLVTVQKGIAHNSRKPNIVFILVDDFGWNNVGYNGSTFYETPFLDKLSQKFMRFDRWYTPSPMCSPTRCLAFRYI